MHLKQFGEILNRVYIRFEDGQYPLPTNKDFSILLKSLAKFHPYADGVHLYEKDSLTGQEHIYLKRTKSKRNDRGRKRIVRYYTVRRSSFLWENEYIKSRR